MGVLALDDYKIKVSFSNGETKIYDVKPFLSEEIYSALSNKTFFNAVRLHCGAVAWNEDIDICPESLYWDGEKA